VAGLGLMSTGNAQADADIAKFYRMRDEMLAQANAAASRANATPPSR
jgi:hypothetical protein